MAIVTEWDEETQSQIEREETPEEMAEREERIAAALVPKVPEFVAMWQARQILIEEDMLDNVIAAITASTADAKERAKRLAKFEFSSTVQRNDPLVTQIIPALGVPEETINDWFIRAAAL